MKKIYKGQGSRVKGQGTLLRGGRGVKPADEAISRPRFVCRLKRLTVISIALILIFSTSYAVADQAAFMSRIIWRGDGEGDYTFEKHSNLRGTVITDSGTVEYVSEPGIYEFRSIYNANSMISGITASFSFTGEVALEVSATGKVSDYKKVVNGAPLEWGQFAPGSSIKWRATLTEGSRLTEVSIRYTDMTSVVGSFGNPKLSGFMFRKPIYIRPQTSDLRPQTDLFHYQVSIKIGKSSKVKGCDVYLAGVIQADFDDIIFTLADQETVIPHYREGQGSRVKGQGEKFWINIPQIPENGVLIYLYYGKADAEDLSNGEEVFDFFDDFKRDMIDFVKWSEYDFQKGLVEYKAKADTEAAILNTEGLSTEAIIALFSPASDYEWIRARKTTDPDVAVDIDQTKTAQEEVPNLPQFQGVTIAPNGDIVLEDMRSKGEYISQLIHPAFNVRIIVSDWKKKGGKLSIDISAKEYGVFKKDCEEGVFYYASKEDFAEGDSLRWRARFSDNRPQDKENKLRLEEFTMDFRPGTITVLSPDGGEKLLIDAEHEILWIAWDYEPGYEMKLEYSLDNGKTYETIVNKTENDGKFTWKVPDIKQYTITPVTPDAVEGYELVKRSQCFMRVGDALEAGVFDISNGTFSIVTSLDETEEDREAEEDEGLLEPDDEIQQLIEKYLGDEEEEARASGTTLYELLIKVGDSVGYKEGDVIMIRPAGHIWGAEELNTENFAIVKVYLTQRETTKLMESHIVGGIILKRRKHRIDLQKHGIMQKNIFGRKSLIQSRPLLDIGAIEDKTLDER